MPTQIVLLGTGTPNAEPNRAGSGIAIVIDNVPYLVDFGPGIVRRAAQAYRSLVLAGWPCPISNARFSLIFIPTTPPGIPTLS